MIPRKTERYENGNAGLEIHDIGQGGKRFWITSGITAIEMNKNELHNLFEILTEFFDEEPEA